jgi:hypothetical protein
MTRRRLQSRRLTHFETKHGASSQSLPAPHSHHAAS